MIHNRHIRQNELFMIQIRQTHGSTLINHDTKQRHVLALNNQDTSQTDIFVTEQTHSKNVTYHDYYSKRITSQQ